MFPQIKSMTWNFSEAGHGKSAADGVGSAIKLICDRAVAHGADIPDLQAMMKIIKSNTKNVHIDIVEPNNIVEIDKISLKHLTAFKGTMQVHQWTWQKRNQNVIFFNTRSCYDCPRGEKCEHFSVGKPWSIKNQQVVSLKTVKRVVRSKKILI